MDARSQSVEDVPRLGEDGEGGEEYMVLLRSKVCDDTSCDSVSECLAEVEV